MGIVAERRKRRQRKHACKHVLAAGILLLCAAAAVFLAARCLDAECMQWLKPVWTEDGAKTKQTTLTLPEREIFALQLGVFDDSSRAAAEAQRLESLGIRCMIWQREKLRIISSVALEKERLDMSSAKDQQGYVISVKLDALKLRLEAEKEALEAVQKLLIMPDSILTELLKEPHKGLHEMVMQTRIAAEEALRAHPENQLYTQLAKSLQDWCDLMDQTLRQSREDQARSYAAVTICALCRELRAALTSS